MGDRASVGRQDFAEKSAPILQGLLEADPYLGKSFSRTRFLVLDEADRLLEPSFEPELRFILSLLPAARQTLLFSATMTKSLVALQTAALRDAYQFQVRSSRAGWAFQGIFPACVDIQAWRSPGVRGSGDCGAAA